MGTRFVRFLGVFLICAWVAACGDNSDAPIDGPPCTPEDDTNPCTEDGCDGETPIHTPIATGTACPGGVCSADGECVGCIDDNDCTDPLECDETSHTCMAATCTDGSENGTETDVDCGGSCAPGRRCDDGEGCGIPADCTSGVCTAQVCAVPACGDGVRQGNEACDDGNQTNGDGCDDGTNGSCRPTGCGNGTRSGVEECDDGNAANNDGCDNNCTTTRCGNGVIAGSETCDDLDAMGGDGCSATCQTEAGYTCTMVPSVCVPACGDGVVVTGEACDDPAPAENGDGCSATCTLEPGFNCTGSPSSCTTMCGDGVRAGGEGCDDAPPAESGDGCNMSCFVEPGWVCTGTPSLCFPICGDGRVVPTEGCDDPAPAENGDGCSATCMVETGYMCGGSPSSCAAVCGDGLKLPQEMCDDAPPAESGDGCSMTCGVELGWNCTGVMPSTCTTSCGDGIRAGLEECDDMAPAEDGDGCSALCTEELGWDCTGTMPSICMPACGDGLIRGTEQCDDAPPAEDNDGCSATCTVESGFICTGEPSICLIGCGDGDLDIGEQCDDDRNDDGDGCSAICQTEFGFTCSGTPSLCTSMCGDGQKASNEACDDASPAEDNDGCSATCTLEPFYTCSGNNPTTCTPICGDGVVRPGEMCDDAPPAENGDGCSMTCTVESGWYCGGEPTTCTTMCGDGIPAGTEQCDDMNTTLLDGCMPGCRLEPSEIEPNEDGTPQTGGSGISGNDFDNAGGVAVNNANANAVLIPIDVSAGNINVLGAIATAGDEDVFQIRNGSATLPYSVRIDLWSRVAGFGVGAPCPDAALFDTGLNIRNAAGTVLVSNDDRNGGTDRCSAVTFNLLPGQVVYAHVVEFGDNAVLSGYGMQVVPTAIVCGDGSISYGIEQCDDGNGVDTDSCNNACVVIGTPEADPNGTPAEADAAGITISGDIMLRGASTPVADLDLFRVDVATATVVRFETFVGGLTCDTTTMTLRLLDSSGIEITNDNTPSFNSSGINGCAAMVIGLSPGIYYIRVEETGTNAAIPAYFLEVDFATDTGAESEPNETVAQANANLSGVNNVWVSGDHAVNTDADTYAITIPPGRAIRAELIEGDRSVETCELLGIDSRLTLLDTAGVSLVDDDDDGRGYCSAIDGTGTSPWDPAARNTTAAPLTRLLQVRASTFSQSGPDGQFIYKLQITIR